MLDYTVEIKNEMLIVKGHLRNILLRSNGGCGDNISPLGPFLELNYPNNFGSAISNKILDEKSNAGFKTSLAIKIQARQKANTHFKRSNY